MRAEQFANSVFAPKQLARKHCVNDRNPGRALIVVHSEVATNEHSSTGGGEIAGQNLVIARVELCQGGAKLDYICTENASARLIERERGAIAQTRSRDSRQMRHRIEEPFLDRGNLFVAVAG